MQGRFTYYPATVASFATSSSEVDLGGAYKTVYLEIPTMTSNTEIYIKAANSTGGTFRRVYHPTLNSSTVGTNVFAIHSSATGCIVPIPDNLRYLKVETAVVISFTASFNFLVGE